MYINNIYQYYQRPIEFLIDQYQEINGSNI